MNLEHYEQEAKDLEQKFEGGLVALVAKYPKTTLVVIALMAFFVVIVAF